ncbi:hypothetical protein CSA80_02325 [Candidatus Saccharibacteria bacterium]|nr:MAG: hypothetical protein CR973_00415 [Candidatus Saccharibacteria bacterium]PID99574.1 MAG: hypothetical protein CSA80_02325 [Candidatus Saccharibacteria bacterium]
MHVLVVEPDVVLAKTYAAGLQEDGHSTVCVRTAQQAVGEADRTQPDAVVLAYDMARHNGIEFLYEFRSYSEWRDIPVILLVSYLNPHAGANEALQRDLDVHTVFVKSHVCIRQLCEAVAQTERSRA